MVGNQQLVFIVFLLIMWPQFESVVYSLPTCDAALEIVSLNGGVGLFDAVWIR